MIMQPKMRENLPWVSDLVQSKKNLQLQKMAIGMKNWILDTVISEMFVKTNFSTNFYEFYAGSC